MTDRTAARAEIRRRIVRRLNTDEWMERHFGIAAHAEDVADAVLELFPDADQEFRGVYYDGLDGPLVESTRYVLATAPEPIQETQP